MLDKNTLIKVENRSGGVLGYKVPDLGTRRHFEPKETKEVPFEELLKLSYTKGGRIILKQFVIIHSKEALKELGFKTELEYDYSEKDVERVLLRGSQDEFLDMLDFAPEGVLNLVKNLAVKLEINDLAKRKAIKNKLGFDVSFAIEAKGEEEVAATTTTETKKRRVGATAQEEAKPIVRRVVPTTK